MFSLVTVSVSNQGNMITSTHVHCAHALVSQLSISGLDLVACGCQASELDIKRDEVGATSALTMKANWFIMQHERWYSRSMWQKKKVYCAAHKGNTSGFTLMSQTAKDTHTF